MNKINIFSDDKTENSVDGAGKCCKMCDRKFLTLARYRKHKKDLATIEQTTMKNEDQASQNQDLYRKLRKKMKQVKTDLDEKKQIAKDDEHRIQKSISQLSVDNQRLQEERLTKEQLIQRK